MSMTYLSAVSQLLRRAGIIRGDTDLPTSFSDLQHGATLQLAMLAIQDTLTDISAHYQLPMERTSGSVTLLTGVRNYAMPTDFVEFWNNPGYFYDAVQGLEITEYSGGEELLARTIFKYKTEPGYPNWWYFIDGATRQVGFYQVPTADLNNRVLTFDYNKDVIPTLATDNLPFIRDIEATAFCSLASVKFDALFSKQAKAPSNNVEKDPNYISARANLLRLLTGKEPPKKYGRTYNA